MTDTADPEALELIDRYVAVWHQLDVRSLPTRQATELSLEHMRISGAIRRVMGKRPGDLPQIMARIGEHDPGNEGKPTLDAGPGNPAEELGLPAGPNPGERTVRSPRETTETR